MVQGKAMKTCCILPVYDRPEFASVCLDYILKNPDIQDIDFIFHIDLRIGGTVHEDLLQVCNKLTGNNVGVKFSEPHEHTGNSFNLLTAVKMACERGYELIHLLEDDVMVSNDYFAWHRKAHEQGDFFATVASRSPRGPKIDPGQGDIVLSACDYAPYGVCFRSDMVRLHLLEHVCEAYFSNMAGYVQEKFPNHPFGSGFHEQDGMIYRVVTTKNLICAFPTIPRCYHAGFYGYNRRRSDKPIGTLEQKVNYIKSVLHDKEALNALSWEFPDLEPCNLDFSL